MGNHAAYIYLLKAHVNRTLDSPLARCSDQLAGTAHGLSSLLSLDDKCRCVDSEDSFRGEEGRDMS